ncbi:CinA family protein [Pseudofulvimonas gallinarii]|uniref:Nicotinamide-nucleotide amidase n=1 Tax=Pseudofulvimonas gallinarii TaxID=634155 RepID=A0A4R3LGF8_9GAMM|nr:CinA family protein [Pseudofulvimonas gallinarii]TCS98568.1 nicotinamide-nucleotide amidase [Pseudofulvimonas gallinarii]THD12970.1 hypothetical protein B1808_10405 [Pseudofulvimonas gallinarii]
MSPIDNGADALSATVFELSRALRTREWRMATAESCTGGWIAKAMTDLAGSSAVFEAGLVTYSNQAKQRLLGVPGDVLAGHGAVSGPCALAMVDGLLEAVDVELGVAVTGIAGPDGGSRDKPVGTVWIAWKIRGAPAFARCHHFRGDRDRVRRATVEAALAGLFELLLQADRPT